MEKFTVDYFIKKFEAIPYTKWVMLDWKDGAGGFCANGHCGVDLYGKAIYPTMEGNGLRRVFSTLATDYINDKGMAYSVVAACINDGDDYRYQQPHPKQRILAALYDIKKMEQVEIPSPEMSFVKSSEIREENKNLVLVN